MVKSVLTIIMILLFFSCNKTKSNTSIHEKIVLELFEDEIDIKGLKIIFIIPNNGCGACINRSIEYMKSNFYNKKIVFIYVASSKKTVENTFGDIPYKDYVLIDSKLTLESLGVVSSAPLVYMISDGRFIEKIILTDENIEKKLTEIDIEINK